MKSPNIIKTENQIISNGNTLTRNVISELVAEFHGEDAEIIAVCPDGISNNAAYVRISGWLERVESFERFWIWICTDTTGWALVMTTPGL